MATTVTNLGPASAYGVAKANGYTGTAAEFTQLLIDSLTYSAEEGSTLRTLIATTRSDLETEISDLETDLETQISTVETELTVLRLDCGSISSLDATISGSAITEDMICLKAELDTPSAQTGVWTVTTSDGSLTISGSISGSTNVVLYLAKYR